LKGNWKKQKQRILRNFQLCWASPKYCSILSTFWL